MVPELSVPELSKQKDYTTDGLGKLFSPEGFSVAWVKYQAALVDGLNELIAGMFVG